MDTDNIKNIRENEGAPYVRTEKDAAADRLAATLSLASAMAMTGGEIGSDSRSIGQRVKSLFVPQR